MPARRFSTTIECEPLQQLLSTNCPAALHSLDQTMLEMHSLHPHMYGMNWGAFDLNLLIVFDAVMHERNVTRAGQRVGLSQPAMSHALNRLRHMLKARLFGPPPDGMVPTARAEQLAQPLRRALSDMQLALEPETFLPEQATR